MSCSKSLIKDEMFIKVHMEGRFNGHYFEIKGEGKGKPYEGINTMQLDVVKGGPLPFGWHILSPQFQYGSKVFARYPEDITDYLKLSFPEGFTWERILSFEDGGVCCCCNDVSLKGNCFTYDIKFIALNFPPNGPVVQKKILGWEPSTEYLYAKDGVLKGDIHKALNLEGGGHYTCEFKTVYRSKKPIKLSGSYYVDTKLDITNHDKDFNHVQQHEVVIARHHQLLNTQ